MTGSEIRKKLQFLLDLVLPKHCPVCLDVLPPGENLICAPCRKRIRYVRDPVCLKCGKPLSDETRAFCRSCEKRQPSFERCFAWAEYSSDLIRRMLSEVKYHGNAQLLDFPCQDFAEKVREKLQIYHPEVLIPVPVHEKRFRERGYNQAEEIAVRLSRVLGIPVDPDCLLRVRETKAQKELTDAGRALNLRQAFRTREERIPYRTAVLVDDIYTTGSTAEACTRILRRAGAECVLVLVLAIGRDGS